MKRVEGGWAEGGLKIHKVERGWWHVTHQLTDLCIDTGIDTAAQARKIVETLIGSGIDFTRDKSYLELHGREICEILEKTHRELGLPVMDYGRAEEWATTIR